MGGNKDTMLADDADWLDFVGTCETVNEREYQQPAPHAPRV